MRSTVRAGAAFLLAAALTCVALPAGAHVRASSTNAVQGGYATITFSMPTESDTASSVGLSVQLPPATPLASVSILPTPGWKVAAPKKKLSKPITTDDGPVSEAVTQIDWTATAGGIPPGQFEQFVISAGPMPMQSSITFKAIQKYSDGSSVAWIETPAPGSSAEPEHPAPTLALAPADSTGSASASSPPTASASGSASASAAPTVSAQAASAPSSGRGLAVTALVLAIIAVLVAAGGVLAGRRG